MKANNQPITWANVPAKTVLAVLDIVAGDGHTIFDPAAFIKANVPPTLVARNTKRYASVEGDPKHTIFVNGAPVPSLEGVYGLGLVSDIAHHYGVESFAMGRGFRCAQLTNGLRELLAKKGGGK